VPQFCDYGSGQKVDGGEWPGEVRANFVVGSDWVGLGRVGSGRVGLGRVGLELESDCFAPIGDDNIIAETVTTAVVCDGDDNGGRGDCGQYKGGFIFGSGGDGGGGDMLLSICCGGRYRS